MASKRGRPLQRKLSSLGYHAADTIDVSNPADLRGLVVWLEDQKIRHYKIEDRRDLHSNTGDNWTGTFNKYLKDLECPFNLKTHHINSVVDWLLGVAVRYEFNEACETHPHLRRGLLTTPTAPKSSATKEKENSVLDISPSDETFQRGVTALAKILKVSPHPDPTVTLASCRMVIEQRLSKEATDSRATPKEDSAKKSPKERPKYFKVTPKDCGFDLGDPVLDEAAKVLRLLHIRELRSLQTSINELIVAVQTITADPKTDQALGVVGR